MSVWIVAAIVALFVLLCPIYFTVYLFTDLQKKKSYFAFYVLHYIKIHGGYAGLYHGGVALHLTDRKALLLPFREMFSAKSRFHITSGFRMLAYSHVLEVGSKNVPGGAIMVAAAAQSGAAIASGILRRKRHCRSFKSDVLLHAEQDVLKLSQRIIFVFNVLVLLFVVGKLLLNKFMEVCAEHGK